MPASDHLHPYQYKLFMQAKELMNVVAGDGGFNSSMSDNQHLHKKKLAESKEGGEKVAWKRAQPGEKTLHQSIKEKGVMTPVGVGLRKKGTNVEEFINDGHHRVAAANDINPDMYVPVDYGGIHWSAV